MFEDASPLAPDADLLALHRIAVQRTVDLVERVADWDALTPCPGWTVRDLLAHLDVENLRFAAAATGTPPPAGPVGDYAESARQVVAAFNGSGELDRPVQLPHIIPGHAFTARQALGFHFLDSVVHGWDLAVATGQPFDPADAEVELVDRIAVRDVPDGPRRLRPEANFGPTVDVPDAAPPMARMLAFLGRDPAWAPLA